jgi:HEPN domain-containing protein
MSTAPSDWLEKAEADFRSAHWEMQAPIPNFDAVLFHAQQCAEKLLKGVLVSAVIPFDRTHELHVLAHQVQQHRPHWTWDPADLAALQPGAVLVRYPDYAATRQDAERGLAACERVRASLLAFYQ